MKDLQHWAENTWKKHPQNPCTTSRNPAEESGFLPCSSLIICSFQKQCKLKSAAGQHSTCEKLQCTMLNTIQIQLHENAAIVLSERAWNTDLDWRAKVPARHRCYLMSNSFVWRVSVILTSSFCNCSWCSLELSMKSSWDCKVALSSIFSSCSTCIGGRRNDCCKMDQTSLLQFDERLIQFLGPLEILQSSTWLSSRCQSGTSQRL